MSGLSPAELERYSRHVLLGEVGLAGQLRLKSGSVVCVGTGGLGSPALLYLAAAGVGRIGVIDFDRVDASNLQRQVIHGSAELGASKVESARRRMLDLNPHLRIDVHDVAITRDNALDLLAPYDVIIDGTDNFPTRYLVNDAAVLLGKPYVYGSISRFEGQASVFNHAGGPNYRDLYPEPPPPGAVPSCAEAGVLGVLPGVIGTIQATEALKLLLGLGSSLSGRLLLYDALAMSFRELTLHRDPHAPAITELVELPEYCAPRPVAGQVLGPREVAARRAEGWAPYVLDVRTPDEAAICALAFADRLQPVDSLDAVVEQLPRDRDLLVFCKRGARSARAVARLTELGFTRLFDLDGGILAWADQIEPDLPRY